MSPSVTKINETKIIDQFLEQIEETSDQVEKILSSVHDSELEFLSIKNELSNLCEDMKEISLLLKGNGLGNSLNTRVTLIEEKIKNINEKLEKLEKKNEDVKTVDVAGRWQLRVAMLTGAIGLIVSLMSHIK